MRGRARQRGSSSDPPDRCVDVTVPVVRNLTYEAPSGNVKVLNLHTSWRITFPGSPVHGFPLRKSKPSTGNTTCGERGGHLPRRDRRDRV